MNKDMMNIDDFVRDKLGGHTEKEDPAAWLRMKALLDKEMPEKAAPFIFRWGKPAAFLGAALLIGALCVGGYKLSAIREKAPAAATASSTGHNINNNSNNTIATTASDNHNSFTAPDSPSPNSADAAENSTANPNSTSPDGAVVAANPARSGNASLTNTQHSPAVAHSQQQQATAHGNGHTNGRMTAGKKAAHTGGTSASTGATQPYVNSKSPVNGKPESVNANNKLHGKAALAANVGPAATDPATDTDPSSTKATAATHGNNKSARQQRSAKRNSGSTQPAVWSSTASGTSGSRKEIAAKKNKTAGQADKAKHSVAEDSRDIAKNKEAANSQESTATGNNSEERKDSISAISVVTRESTSRGGYPKKIIRVTDTIAITKVPVNPLPKPVNNVIVSTVLPSKKAVKLAAAESRKANKLAAKAEVERQKDTYAAADKAKAKESGDPKAPIQSASQAVSVVKVKKEKSAFTEWWQNLNLPEAVSSAKRDFNSAQFYWGVTAGANYSFPNGSGGFQGVQFGATGELVFNKHWSLFGAIKYFNRSGSKKIVSDNFSSQLADQDSTQGANWFFTARTDSTNRFFNFSTVHSFEMPVTLRYTIRKFYVMTGINLAYYLPLNVEKVEREYNNMNVHVITTNSTKPMLSETKPQLNISDFGSRFGMGYVIGAGYQITPAWQTDLRIVNPFWDNAQGAGAQKLSKDFYKLPSVQLSFGYQINRIRNRATFGPNSAP